MVFGTYWLNKLDREFAYDDDGEEVLPSGELKGYLNRGLTVKAMYMIMKSGYESSCIGDRKMRIEHMLKLLKWLIGMRIPYDERCLNSLNLLDADYGFSSDGGEVIPSECIMEYARSIKEVYDIIDTRKYYDEINIWRGVRKLNSTSHKNGDTLRWMDILRRGHITNAEDMEKMMSMDKSSIQDTDEQSQSLNIFKYLHRDTPMICGKRQAYQTYEGAIAYEHRILEEKRAIERESRAITSSHIHDYLMDHLQITDEECELGRRYYNDQIYKCSLDVNKIQAHNKLNSRYRGRD